MGEEDGNRKGMAGVCSESVILRVLKAGSLGEALGGLSIEYSSIFADVPNKIYSLN